MRLLIACLIAIAAATGLALADTTTKTDPKDDVRGAPAGEGFDFRSASAAHAGRDTFTHRVTSWYADMRGYMFVRLELGTDARSGPDYYVAKRPGQKPGVYNFRSDKRVAGAKLTLHSKRSFSFTFNTGFADYPPVYRWRWRIPDFRDQSKSIDRLPNSGMVVHRVATGHD